MPYLFETIPTMEKNKMTTIIIGAGIAGLSAGYHLRQEGRDAIILEGRDRIGGRVWTNRDFADFPIEFGAELIHGKEVNTWEWVHKLGLTTLHIQKTVNSMIRLEDGRWLTMKDARRVSPELETTRSWDFGINVAEPLDEEDLRTYLTRIGFNAEQLRYVQRSFANAEADNMELLNAKAHANLFNDRDTEEGYAEYRILNGYDAYYTVLAEGLDIRLNTTVTAVEWSADGVVVTTARGQSFRADNAIITLPVGVLLANKVEFTPALPSIKQEALQGLKMGPVMKMIYEFDAPIINDSISVIFAKGNPPMWWSPSLGQESDIVVWVAFFSGDYAREMLHLGENKALQKGLETLREQVGNSELVYKKAQWVCWPQDEFALGGYSICLPGHYNAREKLAQPTPPLYWAGEASAPHHQAAMVHGAYLTGQRAANEVKDA